MDITKAETLISFIAEHLSAHENSERFIRHLKRDLDVTDHGEWAELLLKTLAYRISTTDELVLALIDVIEVTTRGVPAPISAEGTVAVCEGCHERFGEEGRKAIYGIEWAEVGVWPKTEVPCGSCEEPVSRADRNNLYVYRATS